MKAGKVPVGFGYTYHFPLPARVIETDKSYYVDRRLQMVLNTSLFLLIAYLVVIFLLSSNVVVTLGDYITIAIIGFFIGMAILVYPLFFQMREVKVYRKDWLTESDKNGKKLFLTGKVPIGSYATLDHDTFLNTGSISFPFKAFLYIF